MQTLVVSQMTHHRHMSEVHEVAVRVAHVGLHAPEAENVFRLPSLARYSAAFNDSSSVMPKPRFNSTGRARTGRPTSLRSSKFCVLRVPICSMTPVG